MKKFTTSAQKTLSIPTNLIVQKLQEEMTKNNALVFDNTSSKNIKKANLQDGSKIIIAAFDKENGKTLAMIDHKNIPGNKVRSDIQIKLKQKLDKIFK